MTAAWRALGLVAAVAAALVLRWSTVLPWRAADGAPARLRQSWSARPQRVERCRRLTDEELARLPAHMRLRTECEGGFARYRLSVLVDDRTVFVDTLRGGGLRHDRPMHVFSEFDVPAGRRRLRIEVTRLDTVDARGGEEGARVAAGGDTLLGGRAEREADERQRREAEAIPPVVRLDTVLTLSRGRVVLVGYDETRRRLVARTGP